VRHLPLHAQAASPQALRPAEIRTSWPLCYDRAADLRTRLTRRASFRNAAPQPFDLWFHALMRIVRPNVEGIAGYSPGEQPQEPGWIKLNTNENPYPPSPRVVEALIAAARGKLNLYPDPLATQFRRKVADWLGIDPDAVLPANGSDENLTLALRTFVDPGDPVVSPYPSYILYETLAQLQGGAHQRLPLGSTWHWQRESPPDLISRARLVLVPNPNSPSGTLWSDEELLGLLPPRGVLLIDEAYGDFKEGAEPWRLPLQTAAPRVIVTRSFSKSFSLAGVRLGFAVADPSLVREMRKVKDSYNCDALSLAAGLAALEDLAWMQANCARIRATRARLSSALTALGFVVTPSQANFLWVTHPRRGEEFIYQSLKQRRILVRYMQFPGVPHARDGSLCGLRISIGTDVETDSLLAALAEIL
jgi:histidinol-phosphate aminotransferase